jgi:hypothetical protein
MVFDEPYQKNKPLNKPLTLLDGFSRDKNSPFSRKKPSKNSLINRNDISVNLAKTLSWDFKRCWKSGNIIAIDQFSTT